MWFSFFRSNSAQQHQEQQQKEPFFQKEGSRDAMMDGGKQRSAPFFSSAPKGAVQAKLAIAQPNGRYEQEADEMTERVVAGERISGHNNASQPPGTMNAPAVQARAAEPASMELEEQKEQPETENILRRKPIFESEDKEPDLVQTKADSPASASSGASLRNKLSWSGGAGQPLPEDTQTEMESSFGEDFSGVRIHADSGANQMNRSLNARAFTHGKDIYFKEGQYDTNSKEGQRLLAHELTHVVQQGEGENTVRRVPNPTDTDYKSVTEVNAMTLSEFKAYTERQADWHVEPSMTPYERASLSNVATFTRRPGILSNCGDFTVQALRAEFSTGINIYDIFERLQLYNNAASNADPFQIDAKTNVRDAIFSGRKIEMLKAAFPTYILHTAMYNDPFQGLADEAAVQKLNDYYTKATPQPYFQSNNQDRYDGNDFGAYLTLNTQKYPLDYDSTILKNYIRSYHRFQYDALEKLVANFGNTSPSQPLLLILHTALDHNGAFIRDQELTNVILSPNVHALMIEGGASLAEYRQHITPIAQQYGRNNRIDQVMLAGHGESWGIEMAGSLRENTDASSENFGRIEQVRDDIDHTYNRAETEALFTEILNNMDIRGASGLPQPHRRILFNACLTNSRQVDPNFGLNSNPAQARNQIRRWLRNNQNIVEFFSALAQTRRARDVRVIGSMASHGALPMIDASGALDLYSAYDPQLTAADRLDYVKQGREPVGVMRAVLEVWASSSQSRRNTLKTEMISRAGNGSATLREMLIEKALGIIANQRWNNAESIRAFSDYVHPIDGLRHTAECRVSELRAVDHPALPQDVIALLTHILASSEATSEARIPLVVYQILMKMQPGSASHRTAFMNTLDTGFSSLVQAQRFVDVDYLASNNILAPLLASPSTAAIKLAILGVKDRANVQANCKQYLIDQLDADQRFPVALNVGTLASGVTTEDDILINIGVKAPADNNAAPDPTTSPPAPTSNDANLRPFGQSRNTIYVRPFNAFGEVKAGEVAWVKILPDASSASLDFFMPGRFMNIIGETGEWYAIRYTRTTREQHSFLWIIRWTTGRQEEGSAFVNKSKINIR